MISAAARQALHGDARLVPQRRPRAALLGDRRTADFSAVGLDVKPVMPSETRRTAEAARGRQGRHGDLLRARAAARARRRPETGLDRRARAASADLDHRAALRAHQERRRPRGQDASAPPASPTRRPSCRPRCRAPGVDPQRARSQCRLQPRPRDALRQGRGDARRALELRGDPAPADAQAPGHDPGQPGRRAQLRRARAGRARSTGAHRRPGPARVPAGADPRRARGPRRPGSRGDAARQGQPRRSNQAPARLDPADAARGAARRSGHPYGWQDPSAWAAFGNWMFDHGLLRHNPDDTALPPFTNEFLPGEGLGKTAEEESL